MNCDVILATSKLPFVLLSVILVIDSLDIECLITVKPSDNLVKNIAISFFWVSFEFLTTSVIKVAEEIFFRWFSDKFFTILLWINYIAKTVVWWQREWERLECILPFGILHFQMEVTAHLVLGELGGCHNQKHAWIQLDVVLAIPDAMDQLLDVYHFRVFLDARQAHFSQLDWHAWSVDHHSEPIVTWVRFDDLVQFGCVIVQLLGLFIPVAFHVD